MTLQSMMHDLKHRLLLALLATGMGAACGTLAGYLLGRVLTIEHTEIRLAQTAARTMAEADASSREARAVLASMNASPYLFCSDAEIAYFRRLLFQSEYLKEAGRMRGNKIDCSAALGQMEQPVTQFEPDFSQLDGISVYKDPAPFTMGTLTVVGLQLGDSYVIISPYLETHRASPPVHYASTAINDPRWQFGRLIAGFPEATRAVLTTNSGGRSGGTLFATRCSSHYFNCVTDFVSVPDALLAYQAEFAGYIVGGGVIGACFGFLASFLYRRNRSMAQQLRRAIAKDKLRMVYQPIVELASRRIVGAEALVRWTDEEGFPVGPDIFVRVAEDRGFVSEITKLVLRHSLREFKETLRSHPDFRLNINVTAADLADPKFLPMLDQFIDEAALPARCLAIEITEASTARRTVAMEAIRELRKRGHSIHIDDFGTGYSSLSYLQDLSIDDIKIDRAFTQAIGTEAVTVSILPQILAMAEALNMQVIVEGIETEQQAAYFAASGLPLLGQGWLFGRPVPAEEFFRILAEDQEKHLVAMETL